MVRLLLKQRRTLLFIETMGKSLFSFFNVPDSGKEVVSTYLGLYVGNILIVYIQFSSYNSPGSVIASSRV